MTTTNSGSSSSSSDSSVSLAATLLPRALSAPVDLTHPSPASTSDPSHTELVALLAQYADRIAALEQRASLGGTVYPSGLLSRRGTGGSYDPEKYRHLGKPVGGTFIAVALVFLMLGEYGLRSGSRSCWVEITTEGRAG